MRTLERCKSLGVRPPAKVRTNFLSSDARNILPLEYSDRRVALYTSVFRISLLSRV